MSSHRPKYPDAIPTPPPISIAISVAAKPMISEIRPPEMISLSISMPPSSQPNQWLADGGAKTAQVRAVVEYGAISGAAMARMTKNAMMPRPSAAALRSMRAWRIRPARPLDTVPVRPASVATALIGAPPARRSLARLRHDAHWRASGTTLIGAPPARRSLADPRIELEVGEVGKQVHHDDRDGQDQEAGLQHRADALVDWLPKRLADAGAGREVLD